ncbi:MAG: DsbE family thiol:disulfide interchange protein [Gallionellaceae bacterium]|jgi:cytochrome c biogenesis protein CcmG/thiol:disulfide interchange protein DsbE|nr:DsbE family thiol:disulfide interchange protein [Gallionellaceae bacterium]
MKGSMRFIWPLVGFLVLAGFLAVGLGLRPHDVPSQRVGKSVPQFNLMVLGEPGKTFSPDEMKGQVWMLNVWASWCESCREEHPLLVQLGQNPPVPLIGMNYKEIRDDTQALNNLGIDTNKPPTEQEITLAQQRGGQWLVQHGNPYKFTVMDLEGRVGIDFGLTGVPETYIIDKHGVIRHQEMGAITPEKLKNTILPLIAQLQTES